MGTVDCVPVQKRLLRVLIVDDSRDSADSLSMLVKLWEHDSRVAYSGEAALQLAAAYQPDVMLLDLAMPKMDGCRLARQLRQQERFKDTLLVAMTGYGDEAYRLLSAEAGFGQYLVKPTEPATIEALLLREQQRLAGSPLSPRYSGDAQLADARSR